MKQIYKIYSSTISFVRAFERAAGVVVLSTTLMFNCATTKSADTSSRYVAESSVKSESPNDRIEKLERVKKDLIELKGLVKEHQELTEIKEQALKEAKKQCINVRKMLEEAKYWCDQGYSEFCKVYKEQSAGYDTDCEKKYGK